MTDIEDIKVNAYNKGVQAGMQHTKPSPETMFFINQMKTEISEIKDTLKQLPTKTEMELANRKLLEEVLCRGDDRYAGKLTEKIVYGLCGVILLAVVGAILALIFQ